MDARQESDLSGRWHECGVAAFLARLTQPSRCVEALRRSVKLFAYAWNRRQLHRQRHPSYAAQLFEFLYQ